MKSILISVLLLVNVGSEETINLGYDFATNAVAQLVQNEDGVIWGVTSSSVDALPTIAGVYAVSSTDEGKTWDTTTITTDWWRWGIDIAAVTATTAYAITMNEDTLDLYRCADRQWKTVSAKTTQVDRPLSVHFFNASTGIVIGRHGREIDRKWQMSRTTDGGKTWKPATPMLAEPAKETIRMRNDRAVTSWGLSLWIGTSSGRILRTTDAGLTWTVCQPRLQGPITSLVATSPTRIIATTYVGTPPAVTQFASISRDAGASWSPLQLPAGLPPLVGLRVLDEEVLVTIPSTLSMTPLLRVTPDFGETRRLTNSDVSSVVVLDDDMVVCGTEITPGRGIVRIEW